MKTHKLILILAQVFTCSASFFRPSSHLVINSGFLLDVMFHRPRKCETLSNRGRTFKVQIEHHRAGFILGSCSRLAVSFSKGRDRIHCS